MYHRIERRPGTVRVVESHNDEMTEAGIFAALGVVAMNYVAGGLGGFEETSGLGRALFVGVAFSSVVLLSTAFSSGVGRIARGRGRGKVIEVDLERSRYRRYTNRLFFWKVGADWTNLAEPVQGARLVWKGPRSQVALRLGQGRTFFYATEPGEIGEDADQRFVQAINRELAARGVKSQEATAPVEAKPATVAARWREIWEYGSFVFLLAIFGAFMYSLVMVTSVLDRM